MNIYETLNNLLKQLDAKGIKDEFYTVTIYASNNQINLQGEQSSKIIKGLMAVANDNKQELQFMVTDNGFMNVEIKFEKTVIKITLT